MDCQCRFLEPNSCFIHISTQNGVQASATHADGTNTLESGCATFALLLLAATNAAQAISPPAARFTALLLMSASMQCSQPALASLSKLLQALPPAALLPSVAALVAPCATAAQAPSVAASKQSLLPPSESPSLPWPFCRSLVSCALA